jgi:hypothetical protein
MGWNGLGVTLALGALAALCSCESRRSDGAPPAGDAASGGEANDVAGLGGQPGRGGSDHADGGVPAGAGQSGATDGEAGDAGAAGASPVAVAVPFRSGSRLKARYVDGGGEAKWFMGFFDTELEIDCAFRRAADGEIRCLPAEVALTRDYFGMNFADDTCSTPLLTNTTLHREFVLLDPDFCPGPGAEEPPVRVIAIGGTEGERQAYHRNVEGVCVPDDVLQVGVATTEVAPSRFVKATRLPPADPNALLQPVQLEGEDGSYEVPGFWDDERGEPCRPASEGKDAGLPDACISVHQLQTYGSSYFAEPAGTTPLAGSQPLCRYPSIVEHWESDSCQPSGWTKSVYEVGALFKDFYAVSVNVYGPEVPPNAAVFAPVYLRGAALPWSSLPALDTGELGSGRLRVRLGSVDGVAAHHFRDVAQPASASDVTFYDSELAVPCGRHLFPDGTRCLPLGTVWADGNIANFADEQCTQPILRVDPDLTASCEPRRRFYLADPNGVNALPSSTRPPRLYEVGASTTALSYTKSGTDCIPAQAQGPIAPLIPMSLDDLAPLVVDAMD